MLWMMFIMAWLTAVIVPPDKWWGHITYFITWPDHLGKWIKENVENGKR